MSLIAAALSLVLLLGVCSIPASWAQDAPATAAETRQAGSPLMVNAQETASLVSTIIKVFGSLTLVIGLMLLFVFLFRRLGLSKGSIRRGSLIQVLDTRMIAPKKHVAVIKVGGECVVVGVTDQQISFLTKIENSEKLTTARDNGTADSGSSPLPASFSSMLDRAFKAGKKKKQQETQQQ